MLFYFYYITFNIFHLLSPVRCHFCFFLLFSFVTLSPSLWKVTMKCLLFDISISSIWPFDFSHTELQKTLKIAWRDGWAAKWRWKAVPYPKESCRTSTIRSRWCCLLHLCRCWWSSSVSLEIFLPFSLTNLCRLLNQNVWSPLSLGARQVCFFVL